MTIINSKTLARIAAIQVAYQITLNNSLNNYESITQQVADYYIGDEMYDDLELPNNSLRMKLHKNFYTELCAQLKSNLENIDNLIKTHLSSDWPFENLHVNLKALLRCGVMELMYFPEVPSKVIINEYTNISSDMLKSQEVGFINSILDTINKEIRKDAS